MDKKELLEASVSNKNFRLLAESIRREIEGVKKIAICGSMIFAREMFYIKRELEAQGLIVFVPKDTQEFIQGKKTNETKWHKLRFNPFKHYFGIIKEADAILVLNLTKGDIEDYIGANTLIEMAFANVHDKHIFLLGNIPRLDYTDEILAMKPKVIYSNELKGGKKR